MMGLIRKEWRENRTLVLGFVILAPLLSLAFKTGITGWPRTYAFESIAYVIPAMLTLFTLALAADLVAADAATGRLELLAALPVRPSVLWGARILFLAGAVALFLVYLLLVEWTILGVAGRDPGYLFVHLHTYATRYLLIAAVGAATFTFSILIDRGFAAALAALAFLALLALAVHAFDPGRYHLTWTRDGLRLLPLAAALLTAAFLFASWLAFVFGRIHLPARWRRVGLAAFGFALVAGTPAAVAVGALDRCYTLRPTDRDLKFQLAGVSPGGRWVAVSAWRTGRVPVVGRSAYERVGPALFAVDTRDGRVRDLTDRSPYVEWRQPFAGPDVVQLIRVGLAKDRGTVKTLAHELIQVNLKTERGFSARRLPEDHHRRHPRGEVVWIRERAAGAPDSPAWRDFLERPDGSRLAVPEGWRISVIHVPWGVALYRRPRDAAGGPAHALLHVDTGRLHELAYAPWLLPDSRPGPDAVLVAVGEGALWLVPLRGDAAPARLLDGAPRPHDRSEGPGAPPARFVWIPGGRSPDFGAGLVWSNGKPVLLRPDRASPMVALRGPSPDEERRQVQWSPDAHHFLLVTDRAAWSGERGRDTLERFPVSGDFPRGLGSVEWFDGQAALLLDRRGSTLHRVTSDGTVTRLLPAAW